VEQVCGQSFTLPPAAAAAGELEVSTTTEKLNLKLKNFEA
jgi:hypothetical protein